MDNGNKGAFAYGHSNATTQHGLTKREYFAAMAMQGILAMSDIEQFSSEEVAETAVRQADELLKALEK